MIQRGGEGYERRVMLGMLSGRHCGRQEGAGKVCWGSKLLRTSRAKEMLLGRLMDICTGKAVSLPGLETGVGGALLVPG